MNILTKRFLGLSLLAILSCAPAEISYGAPAGAGARPADAPDKDTSADDNPAPAKPAPKQPAAPQPAPKNAPVQPPVGAKKPNNAAAAPDPMSATYIDTAIDELRREYIAYTKDSARPPLRAQSTWFIDHPANLDQKLLLEAMQKSMSNDPRMSAYIRWQLLSGAAKKFPADVMPLALDLYHKAPVPAPRYGITSVDQKKLDAMLASARKDDYVRLADKVQEQVARVAEQNKLFVAYRDDLYGRLQPSFDTFTAAMGDAVERLEMGWVPKDHMKRMCDDLSAWATSGDARPKQCAAMADFIYKLRSERTPKYYTSVGVRGDKPYWAWKTEAVYEAKKLQALQQILEEAGRQKAAAAQAGGGIK